jgi:hypothetical protein
MGLANGRWQNARLMGSLARSLYRGRLALPDSTFKMTLWSAPLFGALFALGCGSSTQTAPASSSGPPPDAYEAEQGELGAQPAPGSRDGAGTPPAPNPFDFDQGTGAAHVSNEEIETYSQIQIDLAPLQHELVQKARQGAEGDELRALQEELQMKANRIVESSEMTPERFNEITALVQQDADLMQRVQNVMERKVGG